jgi:prolipoprotein diacylglyceryltransferase
MSDISILDLFWLILKFLAALGLVCLLVFVVYAVCRLAFRMLRSIPKVVTGKASEGAIVGWVLVIVALATLAYFLYEDPSFLVNGFHAQPTPAH